jgi:HK97 family phage prohead protease
MPWKPSDASRHIRDLTPAQQRRWATIANSVLRQCLAGGGSQKECEGRAIRIANDRARGGKENEMDEIERKTIVLADLKVEGEENGPGKITGYGSVFNSVDAVNDTVLPGAYQETLAKFVQDGFLSWGHDWNVPVATIDRAKEDDRGLWIEATFHSDDQAQRARRLTAERLERGKSMGLSIGYRPKKWNYRDDGVRELIDIELREVSLVTVPAEPKARVASVKSTGGAPAGAVETKEGRVLSTRNAAKLKELGGKLKEIAQELEELLASAGAGSEEEAGGKEAPQEDQTERRRLLGEYLRTQARLNGVRV